MKVCGGCRRVLPTNAFYKDKSKEDGLHTRCKDCIKVACSSPAQYPESSRTITHLRAKTCTACGIVKLPTEFYTIKNNRLGLTAACKTCANIKQKISLKNQLIKHPNCRKDATSRYNRSHASEKQATNQRYRATHPEKRKAAVRNWAEANKAKLAARAGNRRAIKLRASVAWANVEKMDAFYKEAKRLSRETGVEHQVDHIIPLVSPHVCGLHVEHNFQVITARANQAKSNKFTPGFS